MRHGMSVREVVRCGIAGWVGLLLCWTASAAHAAGPDVTVLELTETTNHGVANGIRGYSVGTTSCNIGDAPLNWCSFGGGCAAGANSNDHPAIAQNLYRLKNGRMDQIGASWLKHGFLSLNIDAPGCRTGTCTQPPAGGAQLGVGCTDPYGSDLNGDRPLGRKSDVNATTGDFPNPDGTGSQSFVWNQRIAVAETDLSAALNPGASYYVEGQYVAPDDAEAGNGLNNASNRLVDVTAGNYNLDPTGTTSPRQAAIERWPLLDSEVELVNVDVPSVPVERFHVARRVSVVTPGALWHYEYAIHNMNSDRAADRFSVQFSGATAVSGIGFHDVDSHSGEPYDTADWPGTTTANSVAWAAPAFPSAPQNANALRWATMYNFWFDADRPPAHIDSHGLRLFKAGAPAQVDFVIAVPLFADGFED